ncbi:MAG: hypothetical protein N3G20_04930, partial [Verrucomicrobiae bacterium]|nr:hypothetical protein [Verrucomicrobiae bacterium]
VYASGIAGDVRVQSAQLNGAGVLAISAQNLRLQLNNTGSDVGYAAPPSRGINDNAADNVSFRFVVPYYRNYIAVAGTAEISGIVGGVSLGGNFVIERGQIDTNGDSVPESVLKLGVTHLHFALKAGSLSVVSFDNGTGVMILTSAGLVGEADLQFEAGLVGLSGTIQLKLNTTGVSVSNAQVTTPSGARVISLPAGNYVQVRVDGNIHIGSFALPFQMIVKVAGDSVEFRRAADNVLIVEVNSAGQFAMGPPLAAITNFDFAKASPIEWVVLLRQLGQWFDSLSESSLFDIEIPFTGGVTLGETFDWSQLFVDSIYKYMVSVELQSKSMFETTINDGPLSGAVLKLKLGDEPVKTLAITDSIGDPARRTGKELVDILNSAIAAAALGGRLIARINKDKRVVIALRENEIAKDTTLQLVDADPALAMLGFGPGDGDENTADQTAVLVERWSTDGFFSALADILNDGVLNGNGGTVYDPRKKVYTYQLNLGATYNTNDLLHKPTVPFNFNLSLGPLGSAALTGAIEFSATVGFNLTLGFDLGAADVPRIFNSGTVPIPANGRLSADAHFGIYLNEAEPNPTASFGALFPVSIPAGWTATNNSIDDLVADVNQAFAATAYGGGRLADFIIAQRAGTGIAISAKPNQLGIVNRIIAVSPKNDPFATEMGFGSEVVDLNPANDPANESDHVFVSIATSPMKGLFIENARLTGSVSVKTTAAGVAGSLRLGFVEITTSGGAFGTLAYDGVTPAPIKATLVIENRNTGEKRFYISELFNNTSSNNISNLAPDFEFQGSLLVRLANISVGGLGFAFPLGSNPEISVWIPDITRLDYNPNPYDPITNNRGIFVTYPNLGILENFSSLN